MKAKNDDGEIEITDDLESALLSVLRANAAMMAAAVPEDADLWASGRCYIGDMANADCFSFNFGPLGAFADHLDAFAVVSALEGVPDAD